MTKPLVCRFSGIYTGQSFCSGENFDRFEHLNCSQIQGTACYLDEEAEIQIRELFAKRELQNIHFIDSGNFHHLSKIWTDFIDEPFHLLVFDHHSDMQEPEFGEMLSCGGWVKKVLEENARLQSATLVGVKEDHVRESRSISSKVRFFSESEAAAESFDENSLLNSIPEDAPVYISIDKDVLPEESIKTNWDGGSLPLPKLERILRFVCAKRRILGVDICGEPPESDIFQNPQNVEASSRINAELSKLQFARAKQKSPARIPARAKNFPRDRLS